MRLTGKAAELTLFSAVMAVPFINHQAFFQPVITLNLSLLCLLCAAVMSFVAVSKIRLGPVQALLGALFLFVALNALLSPIPQDSLKIKELARIAVFFCLSAAAFNAGGEFHRKLGVYAVVPLSIAGIAGYWQAVTFYTGIQDFFPDSFGRRIYSFFGNPGYFAAFLLALLPLVYYSGRAGRIAAIIFLPLIFLTKSLSAAVITAIIVPVIILTAKGSVIKRFMLVTIIIALALPVLLITAKEKKGSFEIRAGLIKASFLAGTADFKGSGPGSFVIVAPKFMNKGSSHDEAYAHNDFAQMFAENGIAGFLLFSAAVTAGLIAAYKAGLPYFLSAAGTAVFAGFNFPFYMPFAFPVFFLITSGQNKKGQALSGAFMLIPAVFMILCAGTILKEGHVRYKLEASLRVPGNIAAESYITNNRKYIENDYLSSFYAGAFHSLSGNDTQALNYYEKAAMLHPYFHGALFNTGNALLRLKRPSEAAAYYERAYSLNDTSYALNYNYGLALLEIGRKSESDSMLLRAQDIKNRR